MAQGSSSKDKYWFDALLDSPKFWGAIALITFVASLIPLSVIVIWVILGFAWVTASTAVCTLENVKQSRFRLSTSLGSFLVIGSILIVYGLFLSSYKNTAVDFLQPPLSQEKQSIISAPTFRDPKKVKAFDNFMERIDEAYVKARVRKDLSEPLTKLSNAAMSFDPYIERESDRKELMKKIAEFKDFCIEVSQDVAASSRDIDRQHERYHTMRISFFNFLDQKLFAVWSRTSN